MGTKRILLQPAFVLHRRAYRDSSLILEVLTKEWGRVALVARSARGWRSRYRGKLELFSPLLLSWTGNGELKTLTAAEINGMPYLLDQDALLCGLYINELLLKLLPRDDPYENLLDYYGGVLTWLQKPFFEPGLRLFEKKLLAALGYGLSLAHEVQGQPIDPKRYYEYIPEQGFIVSNTSRRGEMIFSGESLCALNEEVLLEESVLKEIKRLMRFMFDRLLSAPLRTRELFKPLELMGFTPPPV